MLIHLRPLFTALFLVGILFATPGCNDPTDVEFPFQNTTLSFDERVDDLVDRLTTEEKIAQMYDKTPAVERLGIPRYEWWNEALHGVARAGKATVFPQAIGLAATFDEDLMLRVATAISDEGRAKHHNFVRNGVRSMYTGLTFWSPNINIFRDPRWGRGQETYGEDPFLTGRMSINFVRGLQGDDDKYLKTVATIKHYAVHSGPEKSRHYDNYDVSDKDLNETYLAAFKATIEEADVQSVMCAYNRFRDDPACGSDLLFSKLRNDFGFNGYVVSDCGSIGDFYLEESHHLVETPAEAAAWAVKAGTDVNCGAHHGSAFHHLNTALETGLISEDFIDTAVKRLFRARMRLGMFDPPRLVPHARTSMSVVGSRKHLDLTLEAAQKSLVLMKNDGVLPLDEGARVAVIGPNAKNLDVLLGNYNGNPIDPILPLDGMVSRFGTENITYAPGTSLIGDVYGHYTPVPAACFFHEDERGEIKNGVKASYFADPSFDGTPILQRIDPGINFHWTETPIDGSLEDEFAVRWSGIFIPQQTGVYQFSGNVATSINGQSVTGPIRLQAGTNHTFEATTTIRNYWHSNAIEPTAILSWVRVDTDLEAEALRVAAESDVIVYMGGISPRLEGEEMPLSLEGFDGGDRTNLDVPGNQLDLLQKLHATGKPVIVVNFSGSAVAFHWAAENASAIVQAFYPGEATGTALAQLLAGDFSPSGRLPVTFYGSVKDLPDFLNYDMAGRTYRYYYGEPLYAFGHGLSYTDFSYNDLNAPAEHSATDPLTFSVAIENGGDVSGEEVAQVYVTFAEAPGTPIRSLKAIQRVYLESGQSRKVEFELPANSLHYFNDEGRETPYAGRLVLTVGGGQEGYVAEHAIATADIMLQ